MTDFPSLTVSRPPVVRIRRDQTGAYVTLNLDRVKAEDGEGRIYLSAVELAYLADDLSKEFARIVFEQPGRMFKVG